MSYDRQGMKDWLRHRMSLLAIAGPADLAEQADLPEETIAGVVESNLFGALQQSQRRRLAWALQVNLKKLNALAECRIPWIDDVDRYLPFSVDPAVDAAGGHRPTGIEPAPRPAGIPGQPQGTPVLGRVGSDGRIETDKCWDEQWGKRLPDGHPHRRDTFALDAGGQFLIVRKANPWEARAGASLAVYLFDDADGSAYFGRLTRCSPDTWSLRPGMPGPSSCQSVMRIEPERVQRIGQLVRMWPTDAGGEVES